eukprot:359139-Chlamydomonas_euryale.AAC.23
MDPSPASRQHAKNGNDTFAPSPWTQIWVAGGRPTARRAAERHAPADGALPPWLKPLGRRPGPRRASGGPRPGQDAMHSGFTIATIVALSVRSPCADVA